MKERFFTESPFAYETEFQGMGPVIPALATLVVVALMLMALLKF
jgi:hypothetical protein